MLHLERDASLYTYLSRSGCSTLDAVDDKDQFNVTVVSLKIASRFVLKGVLMQLNEVYKAVCIPRGYELFIAYAHA